MAKQTTTAEVRDCVRVLKLKIVNVTGDQRERWLHLSRRCQQITNRAWRQWLAWHVANKSDEKIVAWLDARAVDKKAAGKCPVECVSNDLDNAIYHDASAAFPDVHVRVRSLIQKRVLKGIKSRKATKGVLPGWTAILLCHEAMPTFTRPMPILFDKQNGHPKGAIQFIENKPAVQIRIERGDDGGSVLENLTLTYRGTRCGSQIATARKIASGDYAFAGSQLYRDSFDDRWYVAICYRQPRQIDASLEPQKSATLLPSAFVPFRFVADGDGYDMQGDGRHIAAIRDKCFGSRRLYADNYRYTTSGKGRGRGRAIRLKGRERWARKWREFVKRVNNKVSSDAVKMCQRFRCGELIFAMPRAGKVDSRFVCRAGSTGRDQTTWEFFQLATMLSQKCEAVGIALRVVDFGSEAKAA